MRKVLWICWVAPFVGAWIETEPLYRCNRLLHVAPFVGAWIETLGALDDEGRSYVAPFVGAWIETAYYQVYNNLTISSLLS